MQRVGMLLFFALELEVTHVVLWWSERELLNSTLVQLNWLGRCSPTSHGANDVWYILELGGLASTTPVDLFKSVQANEFW